MTDATLLARLFVGTTLLAFASYTDWQWRRAPNVLWLIMAAVGVVLLAVDALLDFDAVASAWPYLVAAVVLVGVFYGLWYIGMIAGGADAKALMAFAFLAPFPIAFTNGVPPWSSMFPGSVVVFVNALIAFLLIPVTLLLVNAARGDFGTAMALGVKRRVDALTTGHAWLMDRVDDDGKLTRRWFASGGPVDVEEQQQRFTDLGIERVWVTPKVPFMIPLLVGHVTAFTLGDVLSQGLQLVLGP